MRGAYRLMNWRTGVSRSVAGVLLVLFGWAGTAAAQGTDEGGIPAGAVWGAGFWILYVVVVIGLALLLWYKMAKRPNRN